MKKIMDKNGLLFMVDLKADKKSKVAKLTRLTVL